MDVKAEVVLLIFTLNCVTLILLGQDLIQNRLCQDRFAGYPACVIANVTTTTTTTTDPLIIDYSTNITTNTNTTTPTPTIIPANDKTIPIITTTTATTITTTTITIAISGFLITDIPPLRRPSPPSSPRHHNFPQQQVPHQLPSPPSLPTKERKNAPLTPSSPSPPSSSDSGRYEDDTDDAEENELTKVVKTWGMVIITTFVFTSVASSQVMGRWIDRWSCRTTMLFPLMGVLAWAGCGLLVSAAPSLPLYLWLVGAALGGSSGGFVTLKAAATIYVVQAVPRWDSTVRLAFLQATTSLGVLLAYIGLYFLARDPPLLNATDMFAGITVLGVLNIFFVLIFLSDKSPTIPVTTTTATTATTSPRAAPGTQVIAHDSSSNLDRCVPREEREESGDEKEKDGDDDKVEKENVEMGKYGKEVLTEAGMEDYDECDGIGDEKGGKAIMTSTKKANNDSDVGTRKHSSLPIDILVIPPDDEKEHTRTMESPQRSTGKRKQGVIQDFFHLTTCVEQDESAQEPKTKCQDSSNDHAFLRCPQNTIPIIITSEDGSSVYGTPPEHSYLPVSRCGTTPSRAHSYYLSCTSLETEAADGQWSGLSASQQQPEAHAGASFNPHPFSESPRHQITESSSSAPSTFSSLMEERNDAALGETQTVNKPKVIDSQDDLLTPNLQLTPASSLCSVLGYEGSNSRMSSSSGESRDVMRGDARDILYDCASLSDIQQGPVPSSANTTNTLNSSCDSPSMRLPGSMMTIQSEGMGEIGEREGRGALAPLTVAGESSGEGVCCAGGGGAGRCLACVAGRLLCRPVSLTFRRRAAGLRGILVADVVATFLVSVMRAGVWEVTPLYLKAKLEWSLADWISYLTCRSCLGVAALVLVLPLLRRLWSLQDTTLGVLGGVSSLLSSVCLSFLTSSSPAVIPLALLFGPLTLYLDVASSAILVHLVGLTELGGVLLCLGSVEHAGYVVGWLTFHYLFSLLLLHRMPGVTFLATGLLLFVPSTIFGVLHFALGLRRSSRSHARRSSSHLSEIRADCRHGQASSEQSDVIPQR